MSEDNEEENSSSKESEAVERKIKEMKEEVHKQQNIISQTSQALNLCSSTPEFSGSTEQVEAERVLLLASKFISVVKHCLYIFFFSSQTTSCITRTSEIESGEIFQTSKRDKSKFTS